jgi:uncharacterized oligopeptide transporter (OPT) family protein
MPLAAGLVGIIPALGLLTPEERPGGPVTFTPAQLLAWCSALAFFGVFVAVPLRYQTIIREQLRFPSGTATASVIRTLHGLPPQHEDSAGQAVSGSAGSGWGVEGAATAAGVSNGWAKQRPSDGDQGGLLGRGTEQQQGAGSGSGAGLSQVDLEVAVLTVSDCCHYYKHVPMLACLCTMCAFGCVVCWPICAGLFLRACSAVSAFASQQFRCVLVLPVF